MHNTVAGSLVGRLILALDHILLLSANHPAEAPAPLCRSIQHGYQCQPELSHHWGMYSPWFSAPSSITPDVPGQCQVSSVQVLSRHGSRYPTAAKTATYNQTIQKVQRTVQNYSADYAFIRDYHFDLGEDDLTEYGKEEMSDSGSDFFERYLGLSSNFTPFIRASGEERVVQSALNWMQGFHQSKTSLGLPDTQYPYDIEVIAEGTGFNNTLNHGLCATFEDGVYSHTGDLATDEWAHVFVPAIQARVNANLSGANLTVAEVINLMDMCPFSVVAHNGTISPFCYLFTLGEWQQYNYYLSLNKYYGYGAGNVLGPTQGVGYVNELIARLTNEPVEDHTSVNHTLDDSSSTFPLGLPLYADFSHDNAMIAIFFALGLYSTTKPLSNTTLENVRRTDGFSSAYTVPFAARAFVEKLSCDDHEGEEMVRILVNHRIMPLERCGGDQLGRCSLSNFIASLAFARRGGLWNKCFQWNLDSVGVHAKGNQE